MHNSQLPRDPPAEFRDAPTDLPVDCTGARHHPANRSLPARSRLSRSQTTTESNGGGAQGSDTLFRSTHPNHRGRDAVVILLSHAPKAVRGHDFVFYQSSMTKSPRG